MRSPAIDLPQPGEAAREHGARLVGMIRQTMDRAGGLIPFARYMDLALHAPGLGYYSAGSMKFGEAGDFVTAPEISPLFGRCLARQSRQVLEALGDGEILEIGAGSGAMACELLAELERMDALPERYSMLELSGDLRDRQRALVRRRIPQLEARIEWLDELPTAGFRGIVLANEVLDAMPVHVLRIDTDACEDHVCWRDDRFSWELGGLSDERLLPRVEAILGELGRENFCAGYRLEINLAMEGWLAALSERLEAGAILAIDYGYSRREYYHPQRHRGTLMCHYRHRAHDDPLILTGLQDITAHVDFTALAEAALAQELEVSGYATQANFLLASGLPEIGAALMEAPLAERARVSQQIQRLTMPGEMGEKFKVMALTRHLDMPLLGFSLRDDRGRL